MEYIGERVKAVPVNMGKQLESKHQYVNPPKQGEKRHRITVVASIMPTYDWSAYIATSGPEGDMTEDEATAHAAGYGNKLPEEIARAWFPNITERYRD